MSFFTLRKDFTADISFINFFEKEICDIINESDNFYSVVIDIITFSLKCSENIVFIIPNCFSLSKFIYLFGVSCSNLEKLLNINYLS